MDANSQPFGESGTVTRVPDHAQATSWAHVAGLALFLTCAIARATLCFTAGAGRPWAWLDALWVLLALGTTLIGQAQRLPAQNVLLSAALIAVISGLVQTVGAMTGVPFGAFTYTGPLGAGGFGVMPWLLPLVWVVVILNARGVARLAFRPWRKTRHYGFFIIGLSCLLVMDFDFGFDVFASKVGRYWLWQVGQGRWTWYGAPWVNFFAWLLTALLILAFVTPFLLNKKPQRSPPFYHPLVLWLVMNAVLAAGAAAHHLWPAVSLVVITNLVTAGFAVNGARG